MPQVLPGCSHSVKASRQTFTIGSWLNKPEGAVALGEWDKFMVEQLTYFPGTIAVDSQEGDGTLLDRNTVLYGSSNSTTHNNSNYPLVFAGGNKLGLSHNQFPKVNNDIPMSNLFVTMLNKWEWILRYLMIAPGNFYRFKLRGRMNPAHRI